MRVDSHGIKYFGQFIHKGNVYITLAVLNYLSMPLQLLSEGALCVPLMSTELYTPSTISAISGVDPEVTFIDFLDGMLFVTGN